MSGLQKHQNWDSENVGHATLLHKEQAMDGVVRVGQKRIKNQIPLRNKWITSSKNDGNRSFAATNYFAVK